jgi:hypothetical protein
MVEFFIEAADRFHRASATIFNTYNSLESDVMNALYYMFPSLYAIGPLPSLLNQTQHNHLESLGSNLWKEDTKCLEWLESKELESVVCVNFSRITQLLWSHNCNAAKIHINNKLGFLGFEPLKTLGIFFPEMEPKDT